MLISQEQEVWFQQKADQNVSNDLCYSTEVKNNWKQNFDFCTESM